MNKADKGLFLTKSGETLSEMFDRYTSLETVNIAEFSDSKPVLIMVDIINGFIREGALHSERIADIISQVEKLLKYFKSNSMEVIAFADYHSENSTEFASFPKHCIAGTSESLIVDELKRIGGYQLIPKNSTNGFHAPKFQEFIKEKQDRDVFIVTGDCTDICVINFCISLKTYFDEHNMKKEIILPIDCVETYDGDGHDAELMNIVAIKLMENAGIRVVRSVVTNE